MKQIALIMLVLGCLWGTATAQNNINVLPYDESKFEEIAKEVYKNRKQSLADDGYNDWALFWELSKVVFEQFHEKHKDEMVNLEILNQRIIALSDSIIVQQKQLIQFKSLIKQDDNDKEELVILRTERDSLREQIKEFVSVEKRIQELQQQIGFASRQKVQADSLQKVYAGKAIELENENRQLNAFKFLSETLTGSLNQIYSKIESELLSGSDSEIREVLEKVNPTLKYLPQSVQAKVSQLSSIYKLIEPLQKAVIVMKQPYDGVEVSKLISDIETNQKQAWGEDQRKTVKEILFSLKHFDECTKGFESVIDNATAFLDNYKWNASEEKIETMFREIDYKVRGKNPQTAERVGDYGIYFEFLNGKLKELRSQIETCDRAPNVPEVKLKELRKSVRKEK